MDFSQFKIDKTLNIEGIIAALAILGATIGFVLNLIRNWRSDFKEKRYRGTNSIILDLLEANFEQGLSENSLWNLYSSPETQEKRRSFTAYDPKKLKRIGFEGQLKHLQTRFLIRLTGPAHYHIDYSKPDNWKRDNQKEVYQKIIGKIESDIGQAKLNGILNSTINTEGLDFYRNADTYTYLIEKGDSAVIHKLISDLQSGNTKTVKDASDLFIQLNNRSK